MNLNTIHQSTKTLGLSLIELLVSMSLGLLVMGSVIFVMAGSSQLDQSTKALSKLEANGRLALQVLRNGIQHASFQGCASAKRHSITSQVPALANINLNQTGISGWEYNGQRQGQEPTDLTDKEKQAFARAIKGSDIIRVTHTSATSAELEQDLQNLSGPMQLKDPKFNFQKDDLVIIADCSGADLFQVLNEPQNDATVVLLEHNTLSQPYVVEDAQVMFFDQTSFYVAPSKRGRTDPHGNEINSLYRTSRSSNQPEELIEGVDSLQIQYGEILANDNVVFRDANDAALNMSEVAMVKVSLLMSSNPILSEENNTNFILSGQEISAEEAPNDYRIRRVYATTIPLNNRNLFSSNNLDL